MLAKLQNPVREAFDKVENDLKEVHRGLGEYTKILDRVCVNECQMSNSADEVL